MGVCYRWIMVCVLLPLVLAVLLTESSASLSPSGGAAQVTQCPPRWLLFGQRCFFFYPLWSSWSEAESVCSQTGGNLASLHTPEERQFVRQLADTHVPVWLGGHQVQQSTSWFWSDDSPFRIRNWTNQRLEKNREGGACMQMEPKSGELFGAPCGELGFYICATRTSFKVVSSDRKPAEPGILSGLSLFDVVWGYSDSLAEEILRSSSILRALRSDRLTRRCYDIFIQQEALYLHRVSSSLEVVIRALQEADDVRSLLLDTFKHYSGRNQSLLASPPPQWLLSSLRSFHSVVSEEPVYWLVALSARASLRSLLTGEHLFSEPSAPPVSGSEVKGDGLLWEWREENLKEVAWMHRYTYSKVMEEHQDRMDVFKAVNIFREHMMNQKSFYKAMVKCKVCVPAAEIMTSATDDEEESYEEATQKAQMHPGRQAEVEPARREALLEVRGGQQDEPGLALSPDGPGASPEPLPSLSHTPDGNASHRHTGFRHAEETGRYKRQEVNIHGVRVKEEEEPMEVDTLVVSDLAHDRPVVNEMTPTSPSHRLFSIKTEEQGSNKMEDQLQPGAEMADKRMHSLKLEDIFYSGGCQPGSKTVGSLVSGANKFQVRVKTEATKTGDQLLSGAKMEDQLLFKAKMAERPFSATKMTNKFLTGVKMEDQFPSGAKTENQLLLGAKMEDRLLPGAKMVDQVFSGAKTEEQLFFGAKMEDQCLRAVLWQDMSVNLASTLLHQLSESKKVLHKEKETEKGKYKYERVSKSSSRPVERTTPPIRSSPVLKVNVDPLRSSPLLSSQEPPHETKISLSRDQTTGCSYFYRCHVVCGFETDGRALFQSHMTEHRQWEHGAFSLHCCMATGAAGSLPGSSPRQPVPVRPVRPPDEDSQQAGGARPGSAHGRSAFTWAMTFAPYSAKRRTALDSLRLHCKVKHPGDVHTHRRRRARRQSALEQTPAAAAHTGDKHTLCCCPPPPPLCLLFIPRCLITGGVEGAVSSPPHHHPHFSEASLLPSLLLLLLLLFLQQALLPRLPWSDHVFVK
ncbi:hypothetical protein L3Q82_016585, partial [Scortum barcoo]